MTHFVIATENLRRFSKIPYTVNSVTGTGHAKFERSFPTCIIPEDSACYNNYFPSIFNIANCIFAWLLAMHLLCVSSRAFNAPIIYGAYSRYHDQSSRQHALAIHHLKYMASSHVNVKKGNP